jgi:acetyl esterase/lipase
VYIPGGVRDTMALVVMVHGGSWVERDKSDFAAWYNYEKSRSQWALLNINYRLDTPNTVPIPMQTDDIGAAIDRVTHNFHINDRRIVLVGMSAGGHLVLLYAYKYDTARRVKAVINMVGPTDFTDPSYHQPGTWENIMPYIEYIFNSPYQGNEAYYRSVSPYYYVSAQSPPTISGYGGQDTIVPYTQGTRLHAKLDHFGVTNRYLFYPNSSHVFNSTDGLDFFWKARAFMEEQLASGS